MAVCSISFKGEALGQCSNLDVIVPDNTPGPFGAVYLLHGLSDNQTIWNRHVPIADLVGDLPLIVVMPDGGKSFYCNNPSPGGGQYEDHIVQDVIGFVDRTFPTVPERRGRILAGNSMGGYGAVMLALRHPETFAAAVSHSGAMYFAHGERRIDYPYVARLAGSLPVGAYDVFALAEGLAGSTDVPALRLDCGLEDVLLDSTRAFHAHHDALGIAHEYVEHPGGHDWGYWRDHIGETLDFATRQLGL